MVWAPHAHAPGRICSQSLASDDTCLPEFAGYDRPNSTRLRIFDGVAEAKLFALTLSPVPRCCSNSAGLTRDPFVARQSHLRG
jgi:hypothetical protein